MKNIQPNALESLFQSYLKEKSNFSKISNGPNEYILSYQLGIYPATFSSILIKVNYEKQLNVIYSSQFAPGTIGGEHVLVILNKFNSKNTLSNLKYYFSKSNNSIEAKLPTHSSFFNLSDSDLIKSEICQIISQSLSNYEQAIKQILLSNSTKMQTTLQIPAKRRIKQTSILAKLKIYIQQKIKKDVQDDSNYKGSILFSNQPNLQKSYLRNTDFCNHLKKKKQQIFLPSQNNFHLNRIIRKIKIYDQMCFDQNWKPKYSHNFGQIRKFTSKYEISDGSVHQQTNKALNQEKVKKQEGTLIQKKQMVQKQESRESFQTQVGILLMIRDKKCDSIGEYFVEQMNGSYVQKLYSYYYPHNFGHEKIQKMKTIRKIAVFANLAKGLGFLHYNFIIHRDIKPCNIMLDRKTSPRIIDFGSAITPYIKSLKFKINYTLRTTRFYNIRYEEASENVKKFIEKNSYEKHLNFDMYAFGKIMEQTLLNQKFKNEIGQSFYDLLVWFYQKCVEQDPNLRINPQDAAIFIKCFLSQFNETFN